MSSIGVEAILKALPGTPRGKSFHIGEVPPHVLEELAALNPAYTMPTVRTTTHAAMQRKYKDGWSFEDTANALNDVLNAETLKGIPNKQGGDRSATEALWLPDEPTSLFAPTVPLVRGGVEIRTLHDAPFTRIMEHLEKSAVGGTETLPISSLHRHVSSGEASSQRSRFSAVNDRPNFQINIGDILEQVKNSKKAALPFGIGLSSTSMLAEPSNAQASSTIDNMDVWERMEREGCVRPDKPVEEAVWSPADLIAAPMGVAGMGGKAAAMALDAPLTIGFDKMLEYTQRVQPHMQGAWF